MLGCDTLSKKNTAGRRVSVAYRPTEPSGPALSAGLEVTVYADVLTLTKRSRLARKKATVLNKTTSSVQSKAQALDAGPSG